MEAGEKELRKAFEDVTTNNVKTISDYTKETRKMLRDLEVKIDQVTNIVINQNTTIDNLRLQLSNVQAKVFSGGTQ